MKQSLLKVLFLSVIFLASLSVNAQQSVDSLHIKKTRKMAYNGYQGGMMLHVGYAQNYGPENPFPLLGPTYGIGGAVRVKFGKYLRVGSEGYVSTLRYDHKLSYAKIGWGGVLLDSHWQVKRWTLFAGGTVGGGGYSHVHMSERPDTDKILDSNEIRFTKYPLMIIDPFIGAEYAITPRIGFVLKLDFLFNVINPYDDFVTGPRFFFGIMFGH